MDLRMPDLNMILLAGNLTNDPKYSETKTGTPGVNFYMASNKRFKDRNGPIKEDVCFVGVVAWDNLAVSLPGQPAQGQHCVGDWGAAEPQAVPRGRGATEHG